jgi:hypothetical protein
MITEYLEFNGLIHWIMDELNVRVSTLGARLKRYLIHD